MSIQNVSVFVPSWRRPEMLRNCLDGLSKLNEKPTEILVIARPEDFATLEVIRDFESIGARWVPVLAPGNVAPIKAGLAEVHTELLAIIDDDAVPRPDWLTELLRPFSDRTVGCVGGYSPTPNSQPPKNRHPGRCNWYGRVGVDIAQVSGGPIHEVDTVQECNWGWRTAVLQSLEFDPELDTSVAPNYGLDLTLSAKALGWTTLYNPRATVTHFSSSAPQRFDCERTRAYTRNITLITLKHRRGRTRVLYLSWALMIGERGGLGLLVAAVEAIRGRPHVKLRLRAALAGRLDAIKAWQRKSRP